ncbi:MAG: hypothetical protein QM778_08955 [Myxococcales bacterium]
MSEPADGMTCDRAYDLLVDVACDELAPELAAAVRSHASGCDRCGPELANLTRVMSVAEALPLAEPSKAVEERILRAAREALAARAGSSEAREPARELSQRSWFARLSEWALSPQVAMASVLLLMVGIGLYSLPLGREQEPVAFEATPDERVPAAPAASATAAPAAEPSPESAREEAARAASEEDQLRDEQLLKVQSARKRPKAAGRSAGKADYEAFDYGSSKGGGGGLGNTVPGLDDSQPAKKEAAFPGKSKPSVSAPKDSQAPAPFAPAPPPGPAASKPSKVAQPATPESKSAPAPQASSAYEASAPAAGAAAEAVDEKSSADTTQRALSEGIAAARKGAYAQAVSLLTPLANQGPESSRNSARLWLARSLRGQGKCAEALRYYAPLAQQASASDDVLSEAADCYDRTGDATLAGRLRKRLNAAESQ